MLCSNRVSQKRCSDSFKLSKRGTLGRSREVCIAEAWLSRSTTNPVNKSLVSFSLNSVVWYSMVTNPNTELRTSLQVVVWHHLHSTLVLTVTTNISSKNGFPFYLIRRLDTKTSAPYIHRKAIIACLTGFLWPYCGNWLWWLWLCLSQWSTSVVSKWGLGNPSGLWSIAKGSVIYLFIFLLQRWKDGIEFT